MFSLIIFYGSAMDGRSKREVLEIFIHIIWIRKMFFPDVFSSTGHQLVNNLRFLAKWSRDISRDLLTQCFMTGLGYKKNSDQEVF